MHHSCLVSTAIQQSVLLLFNRMGDNDTVGGSRYKNSCVERWLAYIFGLLYVYNQPNLETHCPILQRQSIKLLRPLKIIMVSTEIIICTRLHNLSRFWNTLVQMFLLISIFNKKLVNAENNAWKYCIFTQSFRENILCLLMWWYKNVAYTYLLFSNVSVFII